MFDSCMTGMSDSQINVKHSIQVAVNEKYSCPTCGQCEICEHIRVRLAVNAKYPCPTRDQHAMHEIINLFPIISHFILQNLLSIIYYTYM